MKKNNHLLAFSFVCTARSQSAAMWQPLRRRIPAMLSDPSLRELDHMATHLDASCELQTTLKWTKTTTTANATEFYEERSEAEFRRIQPAADIIQSLHTTLRLFVIAFVALVAIFFLYLWSCSK